MSQIDEFYGSFIDGRMASATGADIFESYNPANGEVLTTIQAGGAAEVDEAVASAKAAFPAWRDMPGVEKGRILLAISEKIKENTDRLVALESLDNGKSRMDAQFDVMTSARYFEYYAGVADKLAGETIPLGETHISYTRSEPFGVTAHIVPWNAAFQQAARGVAPALVAGNTAVVKPAEDTSVTTVELAKIALEAGLPPGVLNVVTGLGKDAGASLVSHPGVGRVTFTGSVPTGQEIMRASAEHLNPLTLELGGKAPNIIFEDAPIEAAIRGSLMAININAGQVCAAGSRLLVHRSLHDEVVDGLVELNRKVVLGPGTSDATMGPITTAAQYQKVQEYLQIGKDEGAQVAIGGNVATGEGLEGGQFIEPTIFTGVDNSMRIAQEEIFGPVLSVIPFETEEEAVAIANDTKYGLTAGLWTQNLGRAHRVAAQIEAGQVSVNDFFAGGIQAPFGGYKQSGFGREKGMHAVSEYLQTKTVSMKLS
ncbi:aldehyde dehydrogenase [Corynebacterium maris DSM 45190]|uniref:Aldehyde dehydrogenase n=1 Tax=Corynebacterium maris DSM 45190 TaxID=1224163 RepID=S5T3Z0_9CORY|nr:aldehyde dehydrogenase family protein [Corynebacterium maris]AGS35365.1 aldehyde dehydrogenase [Corynebacterium maris DSM 45190]